MSAGKTTYDTVDAALVTLKAFVETKQSLELVFRKPTASAEIPALEKKYDCRLPPSYVDFITRHGTFYVDYGGNERIGMIEADMLLGRAPDPDGACDGDDEAVQEAIADALFFQLIDDDAVENFYTFSKRNIADDGEMTVVTYRHDERFELPTKQGGTTFSEHIVETIEQFVEEYDEV